MHCILCILFYGLYSIHCILCNVWTIARKLSLSVLYSRFVNPVYEEDENFQFSKTLYIYWIRRGTYLHVCLSTSTYGQVGFSWFVGHCLQTVNTDIYVFHISLELSDWYVTDPE